ncbi:hypothetical protein DH2020_041482 [Rehmannia glutinosa]|uniref:Mitochondrial protein n=1 Tax=Rehmannia glutinosa TaxID=99300 RepID=A0ABR0UQ19_REHGL
MQSKFEMSMMGEATFFLGLQVKQVKDGTFISRTKYTRDLMKKFGMEEKSSRENTNEYIIKMDMDADEKHVDQTRYEHLRILRYLKGSQEVGLWYPKEGGFKLIGYSDYDYLGCRVDRKSTSCTCQMLETKLISGLAKSKIQ